MEFSGRQSESFGGHSAGVGISRGAEIARGPQKETGSEQSPELGHEAWRLKDKE